MSRFRLVSVVIAVLLVAGCASLASVRGSTAGGDLASVARVTPPPAATAAATVVPATVPAPLARASRTAGTAAQGAIRNTIQQSNSQQQLAYAQHDVSALQSGASTAFYNELVQNQLQMESSGVSAIKLLAIQWGPISVQGTQAQAITYETWQTMYTDGTADQSRDQNIYTLSQQGQNWLITADDHPDQGSAAATGGSVPAPSTPGRVTPAAGQSGNWSGYAAVGGPFTAVSGSWTIPVASGSTGSADAAWVGIGGVNSRDLIQAGTDATLLGGGRVRYSAWIETLPQAAQTVPLTVNPGDSISVSLTQQSSGQWEVTLNDNTSGQSYQTSVSYASSLSSAEWIEEAPALGRRTATLDDFGSIQFQGASAVEAGHQVSAAQAGAKPVTMIDSEGNVIGSPSALSSAGSGFSVSRVGNLTGSGSGNAFGALP